MAYDESFAPEPEAAEVQVADTGAAATEITLETAATNEVAAETAGQEAGGEVAETPEAAAEGDSSGEADDATPTGDEATAAGTVAAEATPAFNEAEFLKTQFGADAPATAAELKTRLEALQAKQITPEQEAQLALLRDPAKLAEFAQLATRDFDKMESVEAMRQQFAAQFPEMGEAARERRFQRQFAEKYPTLADALLNPDDYAADDPALLADREDADFDALAARAALKTAHDERTKQFVAAQAPAAQQPQLSPEQQADAAALPAWLEKAYADGATIPVDAGDGLTIKLPVSDPAAFKAAFNDTYGLLDKLTLTKPLAEGGVLNKENHALVTAFLQDPKAFVQHIARQARAGVAESEPAIPIANLTNSSTQKRPAAKAPAAPAATTGELNQPAYVDADAWHNSNV